MSFSALNPERNTVGVVIPETTTAAPAASTAYAVPFTLRVADTIHGVRLNFGAPQGGFALFEVAIYNSALTAVLARSYAQDSPLAGAHTIPVEPVRLAAGDYHLVLATTTVGSITWTIGWNQYGAGKAFTLASFPLPASLTSGTDITTIPSFELIRRRKHDVQGLASVTVLDHSVHAASGGVLYGRDTASGHFCSSADDGDTWTDYGDSYPVSPVDCVIDGGKFYSLGADGSLSVRSSLTAGGTWTDITSPNLSANAVGRPECLAVFNGYLWHGEYSVAPNEIAGGPKLHRYDLTASTWVVSRQFANARHIHGLASYATTYIWASVGDEGYGSDLGFWRLTPSGIVTGGPDSWTHWTAYDTTGTTNFYSVGFVVAPAPKGAAAGLYGASDRLRQHLHYVKLTGSAGQFNVNCRVFAPPGVTHETTRSLYLDPDTQNLYWLTTEGVPARHLMMVSAPPYESAEIALLLDVAVPSLQRVIRGPNRNVFVFNRKFALEKFVGQ